MNIQTESLVFEAVACILVIFLFSLSPDLQNQSTV